MKFKESEKQELKLNFGNEVIESLVAFANAKGGSIIIGANDKGRVEGVKIGKETVQNWINEIKQKTSPSIIPDVEVTKHSGKTIATISTIEYPIKPVSFKGRYYKRVKNSNHLLNINEVVNLHIKTFNTSWDYYEDIEHTINDISLEKVARFIERANKNREFPITDDPILFLKKFELLRDEKISKACFLLFMKGESLLSTIELGRFQTETLIKDGTRVRTDVLSEVDEVMNFITKHINKAYIITGKPQRDEVWDYPLEALRELVINMIVHRDYSNPSDSIVKIFDDRIEFYNPGNLPEGLTVSELFGNEYLSSIRNKQVGGIFKEAGIMEKYGSGIRRVLSLFKERGLPRPKLAEFINGFQVVVFNGEATQKATQKTTQKTTQKKSLRDKILEVLKQNPHTTRAGLASELSISENTIKECLAKLKEEKRIERVGGDKGGHWKVRA